jgi:hypothetical protein
MKSDAEQAIITLERLLGKYDFELEGNPLIDDSAKMASFIHKDGTKGDYAFAVEKDNQTFLTSVHLSVRLYLEQGPKELCRCLDTSSNVSLVVHMDDLISDYIEPGLKEYFRSKKPNAI